MSISQWISRHAETTPEKIALRFEGAEISYAALDRRIRRLAATLADRHGVTPGDRVAYLGANSPLALELLFACARLGAIFAPLNWRLTAVEHRQILEHCTPKLVVVEPELASHATGIAAAELEDLPEGTEPLAADTSAPLLLVYTSGTTGRPKGVVLTQGALEANARSSIAAHDLTSDDHVLTVLPMFHVGGLNIHTTPGLAAGASVTLHRRFDATRALEAIAGERPTTLVAVPQVSLAMTNHPQWPSTDVSSLRLVTTGSSIVPEAVMHPWHARGIPVTQVYGLTESAPVAVSLRAADAIRKLGSCGTPAPGCEARIVDGEIELRGPNLFREYWNDPDATREAFRDGWFRTGDIARRDSEGFFYVVDRKKDMVISGGENISPAELEAVLAACEDIVEASVVGRPDARWGEVAVAFVVARPGSGLTAERVMALFEGRLARFKHPREVVFVEALPRNAMGKVQKHELRARLRRESP